MCEAELWSVLCQYELCGSVLLKMVVAPVLGVKIHLMPHKLPL